jgi:hypothetical protein
MTHETPLTRSQHEVSNLLDDNRGLEVAMEDARDEAHDLHGVVAELKAEATRLLARIHFLESIVRADPVSGEPPAPDAPPGG